MYAKGEGEDGGQAWGANKRAMEEGGACGKRGGKGNMRRGAARPPGGAKLAESLSEQTPGPREDGALSRWLDTTF